MPHHETVKYLIVAAAACFLLAALGVAPGRFNLTALGLFLFMVSLLFVK